MSGVELNANILNNLLRGNWLTRTGGAFEFAFITVMGAVFGVAFSRLLPLGALLVALAAILALGLSGLLAVHFARAFGFLGALSLSFKFPSH